MTVQKFYKLFMETDDIRFGFDCNFLNIKNNTGFQIDEESFEEIRVMRTNEISKQLRDEMVRTNPRT